METRTQLAGLCVGSLLLLGAATAPLGGLAQDEAAEPAAGTLDPADYSATIDHPFFPLTGMPAKLLVGEMTDPETGEVSKERIELSVPRATERVAGVEVTVLEEFGYVDGELDEHSRDYFAQGPDGTVYLFGERVDHFRDGQILDEPGTWLVGQDVPAPMVYLPAELEPGQTFEPEVVPGLAEDVATVVALDRSVATAAGTFDGCATIRIEDRVEGDVVDRFLCAGAGLVREEVPEGMPPADEEPEEGEDSEASEEEEGEGAEGSEGLGSIELVKLGP
jgi:hypothetical protein